MTHVQKNFFKALIVLFVVGLMPFTAYPVQGQEGITLEDAGATIDFGRSITFHAKIKAAQSIKQVTLLFRGINQTTTYVENVQALEDGSVSFTYDASLNTIPPFSQVIFWFQATLANGNTYTSGPMLVSYNDERFPWRKLSDANITVHWYAGDDAFGAAALNAAGRGILAMRDYISVSLTDPVDIYIYSNPVDLQSTLTLGGESWVTGHAAPQIGVALVAIAPEANKSEMETQIPHELAHIMLYRSLGSKYVKQPVWLLEGIASMTEVYANPEYQRALDIASKDGSLIPFTELCASFPPDSGSAYLAYAQSQSFARYLYSNYGASGLAGLMNAYNDGYNCELGATRALGAPLSQIDTHWREEVLGQNVMGVAIRNLSPFMLIMALVLVVPLWGTIDLLRQRRKREELYAEKPHLK